jgi:hypothetical protein
MSYYLVLISPTDSPIYETHLSSSKPHNQIASSSTSTFPSWSPFPKTAHHQSQSSLSSPSGNHNNNTGSSQVPNKDPFPPQFLGGPGVRPSSSSIPSVGSLAGPPQGIEKHVLQMIAFSSLDVVEDVMYSSSAAGVSGGNMYLRSVDKVNEWNVSAFVGPAGKSASSSALPLVSS